MKKIFVYTSVACCAVALSCSALAAAQNNTSTAQIPAKTPPKTQTVKSKAHLSTSSQVKPLMVQNPEVIAQARPGSGWGTNVGQTHLQVNGFLSAGASLTNSGEDYLIPGHGSVHNDINFGINTLAGIQLAAVFNQNFSIVTQLVADGDNTNGHNAFRPELDWAFVKYQTDNGRYQFRAGRFRVPLFLYSATEEIGYTYPWVFLPNEVYRVVPFNNMNGIDMIYTQPIVGFNGWSFKIDPFFGQNSSQFDITVVPNTAPLTYSFDENDLLGIAVSTGNQYVDLHAAYARTSLTERDASNAVQFSNASTNFYTVGAKVDVYNVIATGEFARRNMPSQLAALQGWYAMLGYQYHQWLPYIGYNHLKTINADVVSSLLQQDQQSYNAGLNYNINSYIVAKAEYSYIKPLDGTRGLFELDPQKNHVNMYSVSVDAIF